MQPFQFCKLHLLMFANNNIPAKWQCIYIYTVPQQVRMPQIAAAAVVHKCLSVDDLLHEFLVQ